MNAFSNLLYLTDPDVSLTQATAISVDALTLGYGGRAIVQDISFEVKSGERFAVIGPNGAGKSTLLKGMLGLLKPMAGEAQFLGRFLHEDVASSRGVEVERVNVEPFVTANHHVQFQHVERQILFQAANAIRAVADWNDDSIVSDFSFHVFGRGRLWRCDGSLFFLRGF